MSVVRTPRLHSFRPSTRRCHDRFKATLTVVFQPTPTAFCGRFARRLVTEKQLNLVRGATVAVVFRRVPWFSGTILRRSAGRLSGAYRTCGPSTAPPRVPLSSTFQFAGRVVRSLPKRSQTWYYLVRQRRRPNGSAVAERQNRSQAPKELLLCTVTASAWAWMRVLKKKRVFEWCGRLATLQAELPVVVITRADGTETTD